jgi:hypothetical protein
VAAPSFFNENERRDYPFVAGGTDNPPFSLVVDAGFVVGAKSGFDAAAHRIRLEAVRRQGTFFYLDFVSDAPELFGVRLTFSRQVTDPDFAAEFVDSGTSGLSASSRSGSDPDDVGLCDEPLWYGFVSTGRIAAFASLLPADGDASFDAVVEPALVQNLADTFVTRLSTANGDRTRVEPPEGCDGEAAAVGEIFVNSYCITGEVRFRAGFNATARQSPEENSITLGAAVGAGEGEPCSPVPLYGDESPPADSVLYEGGPLCNETVRSINGVGGPLFTVASGPGVVVTSEPETNTVVIDVNLNGLAFQADDALIQSESC